MTAPAMPRPDVESLRAEAVRLDTAYTQAVQEAAQKNNWYGVPAYAHAAQQARSAVRAAEADEWIAAHAFKQARAALTTAKEAVA